MYALKLGLDKLVIKVRSSMYLVDLVVTSILFIVFIPCNSSAMEYSKTVELRKPLGIPYLSFLPGQAREFGDIYKARCGKDWRD